jgi:hypothetical protein
MQDEVGEDIEDLRLDAQHCSRSPQLEGVCVQLPVSEGVDHRRLTPG